VLPELVVLDRGQSLTAACYSIISSELGLQSAARYIGRLCGARPAAIRPQSQLVDLHAGINTD